MLRAIAVGVGKIAIEERLTALSQSGRFKLVGINDVNSAAVASLASEYSVYGSTDLSEVIGRCRPDVAMVAVPHDQYLPIIEELAESRVHIIKEKPLATSMDEVTRIQDLVTRHSVCLNVITQRRFFPAYREYWRLAPRIGRVYSFAGKYSLNIPNPGRGWRASKAVAGGGALLDMGYHLVDLAVWYFGLPDAISAKVSTGNRPNCSYDVEDTAHVLCEYSSGGLNPHQAIGTLGMSVVYPQKDESLMVYGSRGSLELRRHWLCQRDLEGEIVDYREDNGDPLSPVVAQLEHFADQVHDQDLHGGGLPRAHVRNVAFIEAAYDSVARGVQVDPHSYLKQLSGSAPH